MAGAPPVAMIINSCKVRAVFGVEKFKKVTPPPLDLGVAGGTRRAGARVRMLEGLFRAGLRSDQVCISSGDG